MGAINHPGGQALGQAARWVSGRPSDAGGNTGAMVLGIFFPFHSLLFFSAKLYICGPNVS